MALYALGDLHLHFGSPLKSEAQQNDPRWRGHEARALRAIRASVRPEDTLVLVGDHSWGKTEAELAPDFAWIEALPGRKVLVRGNHDLFWDAKKTARLNERFAGRLFFLQDNFFPYGDAALVGTKGFTFEGPFWVDRAGRVVGWDEDARAHADKLVARELARLDRSFQAAAAAGFRRFVVFLHYPPTSILERESAFTALCERWGAEQVVYAHCHGESRFHDSLEGLHRGVRYALVSGDYRNWQPLRVLD